MSDETYTTEQAREALELLYDCARMEIGNDAIGPRNVLESFIKQAARRMRERQTIPRYRAIGYDPDTRCAEMIADSEGAWVHVLDMEETTHEREREVVKVTDEDVKKALSIYNETRNYRGEVTGVDMRAALESFAAPVGVPAERLQSEIHKVAKRFLSKKKQGYFMEAIRAMLSAAPEVTK